MINLYFDPKDKIYYYKDLNKACDNCNNYIDGTIIIRVFWDRLASGVNYFCNKCRIALKKSNSADYTETYIAIIDAEIPSKAIPIIFTKPNLQCARNMMVFDVCDNLDGEKVVDKTVYSGRSDPKVMEYLIESECEDIDLKLKHQPLNDKQLDNFFADIKSSTLITHESEDVKKIV